MSELSTGFPIFSQRLVDKDGMIFPEWRQLLVVLWNRTGKAAGASAEVNFDLAISSSESSEDELGRRLLLLEDLSFQPPPSVESAPPVAAPFSFDSEATLGMGTRLRALEDLFFSLLSAGAGAGAESAAGGVFVPAITFGGAAVGVTYAANGQIGYWTKLGNRVLFNAWIELTSKGASAGNLAVTGLTTPSNIATNNFSAIQIYGATLAASVASALQAYLGPNSAQLAVSQIVAGAATPITNADLTNTSAFIISGQYLSK